MVQQPAADRLGELQHGGVPAGVHLLGHNYIIIASIVRAYIVVDYTVVTYVVMADGYPLVDPPLAPSATTT